jgi:hypothetical protein
VIVASITGGSLAIGAVKSETDPRVAYGYLPQAGIYIKQYATAPMQVEYPPDLDTLFLFGSATSSSYLVGSVLQSPGYSPLTTSGNVYYSDGPMVIVGT